MINTYKQRKVDVIGGTPGIWSAYLQQVCMTGVTPFFVMDETARSAP